MFHPARRRENAYAGPGCKEPELEKRIRRSLNATKPFLGRWVAFPLVPALAGLFLAILAAAAEIRRRPSLA
jgi:hypothetical protein